MEVTINIPDEMFQEIIENCEKKTGKEFLYIKEIVKRIKKYKFENDTIDDKDRKLYLWLASLTFNEIMSTF